MPLIRKFAIQGHAVPQGYRTANGPFPPEVLAQPRAAHQDYHADSLHESFDDMKLLRCKLCGEVMYENEVDEHVC